METLKKDNGIHPSAPEEKIESVGPWMIAWRKFRANRIAVAGLVIFVLIDSELKFAL